MNTSNLYAPPSFGPAPRPNPPVAPRVWQENASRPRRFVNWMVDLTAIAVLTVAFAFAAPMFGVPAVFYAEFAGSAPLAIYFLYYTLGESVSGRTLGKLITGTRVVDYEGRSPRVGRAFFRALCRLIPFNDWSHLLMDHGWHDELTRTRVVVARS